MRNSDLKTWALILLLGVGGLYQVGKSIKPTTGDQTAPEVSAALDADDEPYSVAEGGPQADAPAPRAQHVPAPVAAIAKVAALELPKAEGKADEKVADKKKKDEDKCEKKKIDRLTGNLVCPKKKKKKKAAADVTDTAPATSATKPSGRDDGSIESAVASAVGGTPVTSSGGQTTQPFASLDTWRSRLLNSPDLAETKYFISQFQQNLVTADIYYEITKEMLNDSRGAMQLLGVMCASQARSVTSFGLLADYIEKQSSGSSGRTQAQTAISSYSDLSALSILSSVMRNPSDAVAATLATQNLGVAANRYLSVTSNTTPADKQTIKTAATRDVTPTPGTGTGTGDQTGSTATATSKTAKYRAYFKPFVSVLQSLTKASDATLKNTATTTLASLNKLLGTATTPTTPSTPGGQTPDQTTPMQRLANRRTR